MGKKKTSVETIVKDVNALASAKNALISSLMGLGWRMAIMVIVPIFLGVKLDKTFDTKPSFTLVAFMLAVTACSYLIYKTYQEIQADQKLKDIKEEKKRKKKGEK